MVLDTPPTRHALDFLEAPERLMGFLDTSVLRWFLKPYFVAGRLTLKVATRTGALALKLADRVLGLQFLQDLSEFFLAFEGMYDGFKERAAQRARAAARAERRLRAGGRARPRLTLDEALYFHRRLRESGMPFVAFVVNRVHPDPAGGRRGRARPPRGSTTTWRDALVEVFQDQQRLARARAAQRRAAGGGHGEPRRAACRSWRRTCTTCAA